MRVTLVRPKLFWAARTPVAWRGLFLSGRGVEGHAVFFVCRVCVFRRATYVTATHRAFQLVTSSNRAGLADTCVCPKVRQ